MKYDRSKDADEILRLVSGSPYFLKLADSILSNMDRKTLAELIAGYMYFKSGGRTNSDFAFFFFVNKFPVIFKILIDLAAVLLPGVLKDKQFRSVILGSAKQYLKDSQKQEILLEQIER